MSARAVVIDYGIGNVFSVCNALRAAGVDAQLTGSHPAIREAERLILPGVGAFARAMDALNKSGLSDTLRRYVDSGRPFLGICIGMQVLMDRSEEFGEHEGLGFVPGNVVRIPDTSADGERLRVPHIGWAPLQGSRDWATTPLATVGSDSVYFVHSFHCVPADPTHRIAYADYGGRNITAAIRHENIVGVQFHPERSAAAGQKVLRAFMAL
jgi:glutamine amidotransferase